MCSVVSCMKFQSSLFPTIYCTDEENKTFILYKVEQLVSGRIGTVILSAW